MYRTQKWAREARGTELWPICIPSYNRPNPKIIRKALPGLPLVFFVRKEQKELYKPLEKEYPGCKIVTISGVSNIGQTRRKIVKWAQHYGYDNIFMLDDDILSVDYLYPGETSGGHTCMRSNRLNRGKVSSVTPSGFRVWQYIVENILASDVAITSPIYRPDSWNMKNCNAQYRYNTGQCIQCIHLNVGLLKQAGLNYKSSEIVGNEDLALQFHVLESGLKTCMITDVVYDCPKINTGKGGCEGASGIQDPKERYQYYIDLFMKNVCKGDHPGVGLKVSRTGVNSIKLNWNYWRDKIE